MIYTSGTSTGSVRSFSYNDEIGFINTSGTTKTQSLLAQQVIPPSEPPTQAVLFVVLLAGFLIVLFLALAGLFMALVATIP